MSISLVTHKSASLNSYSMNSEDKFTARSSKLKVHRANSQTISSYPVIFSKDTQVTFSFFCFLSS